MGSEGSFDHHRRPRISDPRNNRQQRVICGDIACPLIFYASGNVLRSLLHVGGYDDGVATDAQDGHRVQGRWAPFGAKNRNDDGSGRAGHGDRVSPYRRGGGDQGELGKYDRIAALYDAVQWRRNQHRHD